MERQPDGILRGVVHPVLHSGRDQQIVSPLQFKDFPFFEVETRLPFQQRHPLRFFLIVPEVGRAGIAVGDNGFQAERASLQQKDELFLLGG